MIYDTIIIGAGMSGLSAGIRLSCFEKNILILEAHHTPGGLNSYYSRKQYLLDTGLHAMTNFIPEKTTKKPLSKILRQLRIRYKDLSVIEQKISAIRFSNKTLEFSNDINFLKDQIKNLFPDEYQGFISLLSYIESTEETDLYFIEMPATQKISEYIKSPELINMLLCPLMFYGSARENEMDLSQFLIMFKSIFLEGFWRPEGGVRTIINLLLNKLQENKAKIKYKFRVNKIIPKNNDGIITIVSESGELLQCKNILSCAGYEETIKLTDSTYKPKNPGNLGYIETIFIMDSLPENSQFNYSIQFYSDNTPFKYENPTVPVDFSSGVICCPNNFSIKNDPDSFMIRLTHLANHNFWLNCTKEEYNSQKEITINKQKTILENLIPGISKRIIFTDCFTPETIVRYTGHINGAVYGSPVKFKTGETPYENIFICGTDQGFLGIVGSMLSGISIANLHLLK